MTIGNSTSNAPVIDRRRRPGQGTGSRPRRPVVLMVVALAAIVLLCGLVGVGGKANAATVTFTADELLGKPTNNSITINVVPAAAIQYYYKYGTTSGNLTQQTSSVDAAGGQPSEVTITGLTADTKYYYQMVYVNVGDGTSNTKTEHTFHTARAPGDTFAFSVTSDGHAGNTSSVYTNIFNELPDFNIDMGDTYITDGISNQTSANNKYLAQRTSSTMGKAGVSVPFFTMPGNHEQEEGWHFSDGQALASIQARKLFFPTPIPGGSFYTGNTDTLSSINASTYGDQYREDYYSWTWGDALFVVIDPFQYTPLNSYGNVAGDGTAQQTTDQWTWTLGKQQYDWLKATLKGSTAKYKFVFSHNMVGGMTHSEPGTPAGYVRGGAEPASYYEWGGYNASGVYDFDNQRPGWGETIEQIFKDAHVSAYFHGHDHQFVYETRDGIVYQSAPSAGNITAFSGIYSVGTHSSPAGDFQTIAINTAGQSHLRVSVTSSQATVDLINSGGSVAYTYNIAPYLSGTTHQLTMAVSPSAGGTTTPAVGGHSYAEGTVVNISATPAAGYAFSSWSGGVANPNSASTTVTMSADKTVTANFTAIPPTTFDLTLQPGWNLIAATPGTSFPSGLFGWDGSGYQSTTTALAWQGYWCKVSSQQTVTVTGATGPHTVNLATGWNLIGNSMSSAATLTLPSGVPAFIYDAGSQSFSSALILQPGQGAWVNGSSGQTVTLTP